MSHVSASPKLTYYECAPRVVGAASKGGNHQAACIHIIFAPGRVAGRVPGATSKVQPQAGESGRPAWQPTAALPLQTLRPHRAATGDALIKCSGLRRRPATKAFFDLLRLSSSSTRCRGRSGRARRAPRRLTSRAAPWAHKATYNVRSITPLTFLKKKPEFSPFLSGFSYSLEKKCDIVYCVVV